MRGSRARWLTGVGLAAGAAAGMVWTSVAPAGAGPSPVGSWQAARQAAAAASAAAGDTAPTAPAADPTRAQRLRIFSSLVRDDEVDTGEPGESGGDYVVFEERLTNARGERIGLDSVRCMVIVRTYRCDGTFFLDGRGTIEIATTFRRGTEALAITGGTGEFRDVGGQARIVGEDGQRTEFVFSLLR